MTRPADSSGVTLSLDEARAVVQAILGDRFSMNAMNAAMEKLTDALDKSESEPSSSQEPGK